MPLFWGALSGLIFSKAGSWITATMLALGIGFATYGAIITPMMDYAQDSLMSLPANILAWLGVLNIDKYFTIVGSGAIGLYAKRVILRKISA